MLKKSPSKCSMGIVRDMPVRLEIRYLVLIYKRLTFFLAPRKSAIEEDFERSCRGLREQHNKPSYLERRSCGSLDASPIWSPDQAAGKALFVILFVPYDNL